MPDRTEQLLLDARGGSAAAFDALLTQYLPMIEHQLAITRTHANSPVLPEDQKDLRQEAHLAFYRALMNYDTEQSEVSFGLYAKVCVEHALISALRKFKPLTEPLDSELLEQLTEQDSVDDPTRRLREKEDYEALCRIIARTLSPYENAIWQLYISGATVAHIAHQLGRDSRSIHNAIYRIRRKLRAQISL